MAANESEKIESVKRLRKKAPQKVPSIKWLDCRWQFSAKRQRQLGHVIIREIIREGLPDFASVI
jgi:hypothetical protein